MQEKSSAYNSCTHTKTGGANEMNIKLVIPHSTEKQYGEFMDKEIPMGIDQKRAECLLTCLTAGNINELKSWRSDVLTLLKTIILGKVQHGIIPHKIINTIAIHFGLHWDGRKYVR
jgi:hypothetical protein